MIFSKKNIVNQIKLFWIVIALIFIVGVLLLIVGSFYDLLASKALSYPFLWDNFRIAIEPISILSEVFIPVIIVFVFACCFLILYGLENSYTHKNALLKMIWIWIANLILMYLLRTFIVEQIFRYINAREIIFVKQNWMEAIIDIACMLIAMLISYMIIKTKSYSYLITKVDKQWIVYSIYYILVLLVLTIVIKSFVERPRFQYIKYLHDYSLFLPWYKSNIVFINLNNDLQSFPSGHVLMSFALLIFFLNKWNLKMYWKIIIISTFIVNATWRVLSGSHFLSDVGMSLILGTLVVSIFSLLWILKNRKVKVFD